MSDNNDTTPLTRGDLRRVLDAVPHPSVRISALRALDALPAAAPPADEYDPCASKDHGEASCADDVLASEVSAM